MTYHELAIGLVRRGIYVTGYVPGHGLRDGMFRDRSEGVLWILTPPIVGQGEWLPDLQDAATGGVLLEKIFKYVKSVRCYCSENGQIRTTSIVFEKKDGKIASTERFRTLGEACAAVLIERAQS